MDIAGGIVKSISTSLLTRGTINMVEGVRSCFPDLNLPPPTVVSTRIPNLFGDQFPEQLLAIQHIINEKLQDIQDVILQEFRSKNWCEQYNTVLQAIYVVQKKYKAFESAPNGFTWNEFRNESQKFNPASQMDWLLTKITTTSVSWENLLEQLTTLCGTDFELYKQWDTAIRLAFSEAYRLRLTYLMHCAFSEANYIRNDPLSTNNTTREELEQTVLLEMESMERQSATLVNAMDKKYRQVKAGFLIRDCGAKMHDRNSHCGGGEDGKCCELGSKIYSILRDNKSPEHDITAAPIAQKLRSSYPLFRWSVVIVKDYRDVEILVNPAHIPNVWIQRYGSNTQRLGLRRDRENLIMSYGLGSYGCFLCYRDKAEPAVLVFFADANAFADKELTNARQQMKTLWKAEGVLRGKLQKQSGKGNIYRLIGKLCEMDVTHVLGVGGCLSNDFGSTGVDLFSDEVGTFPIRLGDKRTSSDVLFWPEPITNTKSADCQLDEDALNSATFITGGAYQVRLTKLMDTAATEVAVKIVRFDTSSTDTLKATRTVGILDSTLSILKKLDNPYVVRHLGLQVGPQVLGGGPGSYRIIMEYCGGGSLASFVNGKGGDIQQTIRFARELLGGLAYLHKKNLAHRFFCCEHVLFSGNEPGAGTLKIISVGRVDDAIKICGRSYFPVQERAERFTPPEGNEQYGSKTDVFAFGCVVLHLWKGSRPSYTHFDFQKREEFLRQLDESLRGPIGRCWDMKYDERPSALELLNSIPFKAQ